MRERQQMTFITRDVLQQARAGLQHLAQTRKAQATIPEKLTRPHLIRALRGEIRAAFKRGYEIQDILALLGQHGVAMDAETFRRCWRQARNARQAIKAKPEASQGSSRSCRRGIRDDNPSLPQF
jgi:hypothetical protein